MRSGAELMHSSKRRAGRAALGRCHLREPIHHCDKESHVIEGTCLCGATGWRFDGQPDGATACNCTADRRYGALWAYDYEHHAITVWGDTRAFRRGTALAFHFCPTCGCMVFWRAEKDDDEGRRRIAVNLRLAPPDAVADMPIDHFEGLDSFEDLPRDGRRVADYWF